MKKMKKIFWRTALGAGFLSVVTGCSLRQSSAAQAQVAVPDISPTPPISSMVAGDPNIFTKLAKKVVPSVVNISTVKLVRSPFAQGQPDDIFRKFFEDFFGSGGFPGHPNLGPNFGPNNGPNYRMKPSLPPNQKPIPRPLSLGTGFIVDAEGLILTNNHVVADADEIKIHFTENADEKPTDGEVVGRDAELDVALIRVKGKKDLQPLPLGDSDSLEVGEYVVAVGNPFGQGHSVTHGIISAKERTVPGLGAGLSNYLQTDAPINPGNSGGPLINLKGEVIGINNAIDARAQGIGFAIPVSSVKRILTQLKTKGSVDRGYIGAVIGELTPDLAEKFGVDREMRAPFVTSVEPGGPADRAGIQPYDILTRIDGKEVHSSSSLIGVITSIPVGGSAKVDLLRDGKPRHLEVKVGKRPNGEVARARRQSSPPAQNQPEIGAEVENLTPELARRFGWTPDQTSQRGVLVTEVEPGSPAAEAGLSPGDLILEVDRKQVADVGQFFSRLTEKKSYLLRIRKPSEDPSRGNFAVVVLKLK